MQTAQLLRQIRACRACEKHLPLGPRPVVQASRNSRLLIVGQAPGRLVHETGIPWNDASGYRLREWLGLSSEIFYDASAVALVPIGFCYPGRAEVGSGDKPPRSECFELWHEKLMSSLKNVELTILVGGHAQRKYLRGVAGARGRASTSGLQSSTELIRDWRAFLPSYIPLPHPSPRNNIWLHKNPWFTRDVVPEVREMVRAVLEH